MSEPAGIWFPGSYGIMPEVSGFGYQIQAQGDFPASGFRSETPVFEVYLSSFLGLLLDAGPEEFLHLPHEFSHVLKIQINTGKPDVSYLIELF